MRRLAIMAGMLAFTTPALAEVTRFEVTEDVPAFAGRSFGEAGAYRCITGRATVALDHAQPRDAAQRGRTSGSPADVAILRPSVAWCLLLTPNAEALVAWAQKGELAQLR